MKCWHINGHYVVGEVPIQVGSPEGGLHEGASPRVSLTNSRIFPPPHNSLGILCWGRSLKIQREKKRKVFYVFRTALTFMEGKFWPVIWPLITLRKLAQVFTCMVKPKATGFTKAVGFY